MLRASRPEPIRVSRRTRLARMRATSGGALLPATGEPVSAVLAPCQRSGLRIGGSVRECIDAGAAHRVVGQRIGVHRDEQRRAMRLRLGDPVVQRDEGIAGPRQLDPIAAPRLQLALQFNCGGQRHLLLVGAGYSDRTGILAAMAWVQHHQWRWRPRTLPAGRSNRAMSGTGRGCRQCGTQPPAGQQECADDARPRAETAE